MDGLNEWFEGFAEPYKDEMYFIKRKAEYASKLIHYLIFAVAVLLGLEAILVGVTAYKHISTVCVFICFGSILLLIRKKHLELAINILILAGFARLFMIYFYPTPFQFYVMSLVNIVIIAVIHARAYQIRCVYMGVLLMMIGKIPVYFHMVNQGEIHWRAYTQSIYAVILYAIFILMTEFIVNIINREISTSQQLQAKAQTDHLTGLYNRSFFWEYQSNLEKSIEHYSILLLDIDHFKNINDTLGHHEGDQVLIKLAHILKNEVNSFGQVYRWGGEEFLIFLPNTSIQEGVMFGELIRTAVENGSLCDAIHVTVSLGVEDNQNSSNIEDVISKADTAMYTAKQAGRNQTRVHRVS